MGLYNPRLNTVLDQAAQPNLGLSRGSRLADMALE